MADTTPRPSPSRSDAQGLPGVLGGMRKLWAVVYFDMVGYSRLIGQDDVQTIERLRTLRREVIDPHIQRYDGRLVQTAGDSLLIVFDSITKAVRCSVDVQRQMAAHCRDQLPGDHICFRAGIDLGDVILEGSDAHGEGINIAVRLQTACPPGGICISRTAYENVRGGLDVSIERLGLLELKNIGRPIEAFVLRLPARTHPDIHDTRPGCDSSAPKTVATDGGAPLQSGTSAPEAAATGLKHLIIVEDGAAAGPRRDRPGELAASNQSRGSIRDRLSLNARAQLIGRTDELGTLWQALSEGIPVVIHLHGLPGIGKSALATAFVEEARSSATTLTIDCGAVEPTERGLLAELARVLGCSAQRDNVVGALADRPPPALLVFDNYEVFRLLDAWIRQVFLPALPDRVLVLLVSRLPPADAWSEAPAWQGLFRAMPIGLLSDDAAAELLNRLDMPAHDVPRTIGFAAGHPLALTLAASAARLPASERALGEPTEAIVSQLARRYLTGIPDAGTRQSLRVACLMRRVTRGLLHALSPGDDADALYAELSALPFVMAARDGLAVHEAVREALAAELLAADPELHRRSRRQAWRYLSQEARAAPAGELWRCTADLIHLLRNPGVREAFFPRDAVRLAVEPARSEDRQAILDITQSHDGDLAVSCMGLWWEAFPEAFFVARAPNQPVAGFYCLLDAAAAISAEAALRQDPVVLRFAQELREHPIPRRQTALLLRRWLSRYESDAPSPVQAACWLDIKRHYLERRPSLRLVYLAVSNIEPYAAAAGLLGFMPLPGAIHLGDRQMQAAVLDMGPGSVDGWLLRMAAEELGIPSEPGLLDQVKRALHVEGTLVPLTRREFDVMAYLVAREGDPVARDSLIQDVWGLRFDPGSNVVDAVIASLRRKLGGHSGAIETVRGFGYLYREAAEPVPEG